MARAPTSRYWCFTEWDECMYEDFEAVINADGLPTGVSYLTFQPEMSKTKGLHLQGYVQLTRAQSLAWLKKRLLSNSCHWEIQKKTNENARDYCRPDHVEKNKKTKAENGGVMGPYREYGEFKPTGGEQGSRTDIYEVKKMIDEGATSKEVADAHFGTWLIHNRALEKYKSLSFKPREKILNIVLLGKPGSGKSYHVEQTFKNFFRKPQQSKWFDGYNGEEVIVFEEHNNAWFSWNQLMMIMDKYPIQVETKGSHVQLSNNTNVFTCNKAPEDWYRHENQNVTLEALYRRISLPLGQVILIDEDHQLSVLDNYPPANWENIKHKYVKEDVLFNRTMN